VRAGGALETGKGVRNGDKDTGGMVWMLDAVPLVGLCIGEVNLEPRKGTRLIKIWLPDSLSREIYY
jgi:hypothetical protein